MLKRCTIIYWRSPSYNLVRTILTLTFALIFGTAYSRLAWNQSDITARMSWCYTTTFYVGLTFMLSGLSVLLEERSVYYREKASRMYAPWIYGFAFQLAELPYVTINSFIFLVITWVLSDINHKKPEAEDSLDFFRHWLAFWLFTLMCTYMGHAIASVSANMEVGNALGPGMASWLSSFSGFYLPGPAIGKAYSWIYWLNPFRYTYESLVVNMFKQRTMGCSPSELRTGYNGSIVCPITKGSAVLDINGLHEDWWWLDQSVVFGYTIAFMVATLMALRFLTFNSK
eukprot:NODE_4493_length_1159_cov_43.544402_g3975_i0.p1 GENE.NODE_4493_length_1159_cov_43.544402_g3975_i0~~NODE_4493_length_1159_cov_43.544402_g3975_i0.p1  ORF type:complete len:301 (+),score=36.80 NODE_4493_length_1159_cov_43.544402_g3975_i0:51-905(+)